jgi:3-oxoacyl-[acyl-carrier-protein] synthase-1
LEEKAWFYPTLNMNIYFSSDNIISSLGLTTSENAAMLEANITGIRLHEESSIAPAPFWASMADRDRINNVFSTYANPAAYTTFEKFVICSMKEALSDKALNLKSERILCILSTTKGNVDLLNKASDPRFESNRVYLWRTAQVIQQFFGFYQTPVVVSNACISGVLAVITAARLIKAGKYDHIIVTGADIVTEFVLSGFNSFLSLCQGPCKPFDKERQGLSLGEAAGTIILTRDRDLSRNGIIAGEGFSTNDANHISGPSRTGEGLFIAITRALKGGSHKPDYISAHGTATPYNDEMESIAITRSGLNDIPVNSLKGYWGHTLGAAGIVEIVAGLYSMRNNILFKTLGYSVPGVSNPIEVIDHNINKSVNSFLKIASGFGGSNASLLIYR